MSQPPMPYTPAHASHHYTTTGLDNRKIAIWAFIGSECMLFVSLISTYLIYKGRSVVGPLPHEAVDRSARPAQAIQAPILNIPVTSASTFVLLMSSLAMVLALTPCRTRSSQRTIGERILGSSKLWLLAPRSPERLPRLPGVRVHLVRARRTDDQDNLFGSSFFIADRLPRRARHGRCHLAADAARIDSSAGCGPADALNVDICALYWHFVDVVWIAIFTLVYLIQ